MVKVTLLNCPRTRYSSKRKLDKGSKGKTQYTHTHTHTEQNRTDRIEQNRNTLKSSFSHATSHNRHNSEQSDLEMFSHIQSTKLPKSKVIQVIKVSSLSLPVYSMVKVVLFAENISCRGEKKLFPMYS